MNKAKLLGTITSLLLLGGTASAQSVQNPFCFAAPPDSCGIVAAPRFVNVYWGIAPQIYTPGLSSDKFSADRFDAWIGALVHSQYGLGMQQYGIIGGMTTAPSIYMSVECPGVPVPDTIDDDQGPTEAHALANALADCISANHPELGNDRTVLNVVLGSQVLPGTGWCPGSGANHHEYHGYSMTFTPTNSMCGDSVAAGDTFRSATRRVTHEMVEAVTHRLVSTPGAGIGWWDSVPGDGKYYQDEIADLCEVSGGVPGLPHHAKFLRETMNGEVSTYWSDEGNGCTAGFIDPPPEIVGAPTVSGSGRNMKFTFTGILGGKPWDLKPNTHSPGGGFSTLYVSAKITSAIHDWGAGNFSGVDVEDTVGFKNIEYDVVNGMDRLTITGFDDFYETYDGETTPTTRMSVAPGDTIQFTIYNPATGQAAPASATQIIAPIATKTTGVKVVAPSSAPFGWTFFNDASVVVGTLLDDTNGPIEGAAPTVTMTGGTAHPLTDSLGGFSTPLTPATAGTQTVQLQLQGGPDFIPQSITVHVHPEVDSLDTTIGDVAGNQTVTLDGAGFIPGNTQVLMFCGANSHSIAATNVQVSNDGKAVQFTTPASPCQGPGSVEVIPFTGGEMGLRLTYLYVIPDQPQITFVPICPVGQTIQVDAYASDGQTSTEQIQLDATQAAFQGAGNQLVNTMVVSAGTSLNLFASSPVTVTATPVGKPQLAVTQTFTPAPFNATCLPAQSFKATVMQVPGTGPYTSFDLTPDVQPGLATWVYKAVDARAPAPSIQLVGDAAAELAPTLAVRVVGTQELAAELVTSPLVLSAGPLTSSVEGQVLQVHSTALPSADSGTALSAVFHRPARFHTFNMAIVWRGGAGDAWQPLHTTINEDGTVVADVLATGDYALVVRQR